MLSITTSFVFLGSFMVQNLQNVPVRVSVLKPRKINGTIVPLKNDEVKYRRIYEV